jgi:hypothetical protein
MDLNRLGTAALISELEQEWDLEAGFFGQLRAGRFREAEFRRLEQLLVRVSDAIGQLTSLDRRLVSLLWFIPLFMEWQHERVRECGGEFDYARCRKATDKVTNAIQDMLGMP